MCVKNKHGCLDNLMFLLEAVHAVDGFDHELVDLQGKSSVEWLVGLVRKQSHDNQIIIACVGLFLTQFHRFVPPITTNGPAI